MAEERTTQSVDDAGRIERELQQLSINESVDSSADLTSANGSRDSTSANASSDSTSANASSDSSSSGDSSDSSSTSGSTSRHSHPRQRSGRTSRRRERSAERRHELEMRKIELESKKMDSKILEQQLEMLKLSNAESSKRADEIRLMIYEAVKYAAIVGAIGGVCVAAFYFTPAIIQAWAVHGPAIMEQLALATAKVAGKEAAMAAPAAGDALLTGLQAGSTSVAQGVIEPLLMLLAKMGLSFPGQQ